MSTSLKRNGKGEKMKRQLTSEYTSHQIRQGFLQLLQKKDYDSITVKDISEEAGINRTTFYLFYDSKSALAKETCAIFLNGFTERMTPQLYKSSPALLTESFDYVYQNKEVILSLWKIQDASFSPYLIMQNAFVEKLRLKFTDDADGALTADQDYYCELFAACAMATIRWWLEQEEYIPSEKITEYVFTCVHQGLNALLAM